MQIMKLITFEELGWLPPAPPPNGSTAPVGLDLLIIEAAQSHTHTHHSIGLLCMSDQPDAQHSQQTYIHALDEIRTRNSSKRAAADPRLRPRGP